jgi:hypothetical protein
MIRKNFLARFHRLKIKKAAGFSSCSFFVIYRFLIKSHHSVNSPDELNANQQNLSI